MARERNDEQRGKILEVAYDLLLKKGYDAVTMKEIASKSGITPSLLQHYYSKKEVILVQIFYNILDALHVFMDRYLYEDIKKETVSISGLYVSAEYHLFFDLISRDKRKLLKLYSKILFNAQLLTAGSVFALENSKIKDEIFSQTEDQQGLYLLNGILSQLVSQNSLYHHPSIEEALRIALHHYLLFIGLSSKESKDLLSRSDALVTQEIKDKCYAEYQHDEFFPDTAQFIYYDVDTPF